MTTRKAEIEIITIGSLREIMGQGIVASYSKFLFLKIEYIMIFSVVCILMSKWHGNTYSKYNFG